jgi:TnpA family transposase
MISTAEHAGGCISGTARWAVAYRHVADNYIANFRHFIPPGMLEAIYVIEGLLKRA